MKWIGQHIWDFISRFRSDVYLEDLSTTTESNVLVVDSNGKVSKNTSDGGDITSVIGGTNCTVSGGTSGDATVNVDDAFLINDGSDTTTGTITAGGFTVGTNVITDDSIVMTPSTSDIVTIAAATNGILNVTTVDDNAEAADLTFTIDGKITMTPADITGDVFHLDADADTDNIVNIDAGSLDIDASDDITIDAADNIDIRAADNLALITSSADGLLSLVSAHTAGQAVHVDGNANAGSIVDIDAGILDIDVTGVTTLDTTELTITGKTIMPVRKYELPSSTVGDYKGGDIYYYGDGSTVLGGIYYINGTNWTLADADAEASTSGLLAVALGDDPDVDGMLLRGFVTLKIEIEGTEAIGSPIYLSATNSGIATITVPGSGDFVRVLGYSLNTHAADERQVYFNPDNTWVEVA